MSLITNAPGKKPVLLNRRKMDLTKVNRGRREGKGVCVTGTQKEGLLRWPAVGWEGRGESRIVTK